MRVASGRFDVDRHPRRPGRGSRRSARAIPGSGSIASSANAPAAEVDGGACERVVHRHDRVAVAGDPAAVAEREVERLPERERRVLDRVVVAGLESPRALDRRDRARRGRRAARGSGRRVRRRSRRAPGSRRRGRAAPRSASRPSPEGDGRDGRQPRRPERRRRAGGERFDEQVVVLAVANGDPDRRRRRRARRSPLAQQPLGERTAIVDRDEDEVRAAREAAAAECAQRRGEPLALLDHGPDVGRRGERRERERGRERRDRRRRLAGVQLGGDVGRGERIADPRARERERLRERAQHDHAVVDERRPPSRREYSKYASSTTSGRASGSGAQRAVGLFGRQGT